MNPQDILEWKKFIFSQCTSVRKKPNSNSTMQSSIKDMCQSDRMFIIIFNAYSLKITSGKSGKLTYGKLYTKHLVEFLETMLKVSCPATY